MCPGLFANPAFQIAVENSKPEHGRDLFSRIAPPQLQLSNATAQRPEVPSAVFQLKRNGVTCAGRACVRPEPLTQNLRELILFVSRLAHDVDGNLHEVR